MRWGGGRLGMWRVEEGGEQNVHPSENGRQESLERTPLGDRSLRKGLLRAPSVTSELSLVSKLADWLVLLDGIEKIGDVDPYPF